VTDVAAPNGPDVSDAATDPRLELTDIWKRYPGVVALKGVTFSVRPGEVHALLGENGAGKSTLVGIAAGYIAPDEGTITIGGDSVASLTPMMALRRGLAIVHQDPALLPDLSVLENMVLAVPRDLRASQDRSDEAWARQELDRVGCAVDLHLRVDEVGVANRQLVELAKAFSIAPSTLILDEPTAPLGAERVDRLFTLIRDAAARGTAVVYISHRLPEVRAIADRVTVLRDGAVQGAFAVGVVTDDELLELIVGRALEAAFPPKASSVSGESRGLVVETASGDGFADVSLTVKPGEIVGLAGIAGNGQTEFVRALAGLVRSTGQIVLDGRPVDVTGPASARASGISYLSADRHREGIFGTLSVRENAAISALHRFAIGPVVRRQAEANAVHVLREQLRIRTPSIETPVSSLSGGNQQKVVLGRSILAEPRLMLVDEPTQGVDAGARIEIYGILRQIAQSGVPVLVISSDTLELEGLCDRVYVFSRGHVVAELGGESVTERHMAQQMVMATALRRDDQRDVDAKPGGLAARLRRFSRDDAFPSLILLAIIAVLGTYTFSVNTRVLSEFNIGSALTLLAALGLISLGQTTVILTGGIDISVGPLAGLVVVVASLFIVAGASPGVIAVGLAAMLATAVTVGLVNGSLVRFGRFTPVAATLTTFIAIQGVSLILRPTPGGTILPEITDAIEARLGPIPVAFLLTVLLAVAMELALRRSRAGLALRAVGSNARAAHRIGVPVSRTTVMAYVVSSFLIFLGGIMVMAQIAIGDASQGVEYTLWSVTAVVLGGTSLFGGRGSYLGTLLGAALIQQILNATVFLGLSQEWQFWLLGLLTLVAAGVYSLLRGGRRLA
jgi:ribose transport system ATP-binding protein